MARPRKTEPHYSENKLAKTLMGRENKTPDKQLEYAANYNAQFDNLRIRVPAGEADAIKKYAIGDPENGIDGKGWKSINQFVRNAIDYIITLGLTESQVSEVLNTAIRDAAKSNQ